MIWTDLSTAPRPGADVAAVGDVTGATPIALETAAGVFPLLLVQTPGGIRAYVNMCPHQFLPLDYRGSRLLSQDGRKLMCSVHGAMFDAATGEGVAGEGIGCALIPVPVHVQRDRIVIASVAAG